MKKDKNSKQKNRKGIVVLLITLLIAAILGGYTALKLIDDTEESRKTGNITVSYYDDVYQSDSPSLVGPCEADKLSDSSSIIFVFTKPFERLRYYDQARVVKKVRSEHGSAKTSLPPGKYGLYMIDANGKKSIYGNLSIENASKNKPLDEQGPWFIKVNNTNNNFNFIAKFAC